MKKILLVEDNQTHISMYKTLFENANYEVVIAKDGGEGLTMALDQRPDLIVCDIMMPHVDGISFMNHLRADDWGKDAKLILLTNLDPDDKILDAVNKDLPSYYLIKSNTLPADLIEKVNELLKDEEETKESIG